MADDLIRRLVPAVAEFFDKLGAVPETTGRKVQTAMWALLDELGVDLDEFRRAFERHLKTRR